MVPDHGRSYFSYLFPKTDSNYFHYSSCAALHGQLTISATAELLFINCSLSAHFSVPYKLATDNVRQSIKAVLNVDCLVHFYIFSVFMFTARVRWNRPEHQLERHWEREDRV